MVGIGSSILGGITGAMGAKTQAAGQQIGIAGSMLQTIGQAFGFKAQAQQYEYQSNINQYQAAVADMNKKIAEQNADYELDVGEITGEQIGMKYRHDLGTAKAAQGASGIDVNSGSSVEVRESMVEMGQWDQALNKASAARRAYGYTVEAANASAQADVYRYTATMNTAQAANAMTAAGITEKALPLQQQAMSLAGTAGNINAFGSLVNTAGSVASKWTSGNMSGLFGSKAA